LSGLSEILIATLGWLTVHAFDSPIERRAAQTNRRGGDWHRLAQASPQTKDPHNEAKREIFGT
jgi:hypothetical protein